MELEDLHYKKLLEESINTEWYSYYLKHESSDGYYDYYYSYIAYKDKRFIEYRIGSNSREIPYKELYEIIPKR